MVKSTKILRTYMLDDPFKNDYFVTRVSFAEDHLTTSYNVTVARQAKHCLSETLIKLSPMVQRS